MHERWSPVAPKDEEADAAGSWLDLCKAHMRDRKWPATPSIEDERKLIASNATVFALLSASRQNLGEPDPESEPRTDREICRARRKAILDALERYTKEKGHNPPGRPSAWVDDLRAAGYLDPAIRNQCPSTGSKLVISTSPPLKGGKPSQPPRVVCPFWLGDR